LTASLLNNPGAFGCIAFRTVVEVVFLSQDEYKLKVVRSESGELEIQANRAGLKDLAEVCQSLSELTEEQAKTPANHYHIADYMNNAEEGSLELIILYRPDM
jgi:hypothetical protein